MKHINLRIQLYIKSAKINISNRGTNHLVVRYSNCYESQRQYPIGVIIILLRVRIIYEDCNHPTQK